jgi:hypothetical protein
LKAALGGMSWSACASMPSTFLEMLEMLRCDAVKRQEDAATDKREARGRRLYHDVLLATLTTKPVLAGEFAVV